MKATVHSWRDGHPGPPAPSAPQPLDVTEQLLTGGDPLTWLDLLDPTEAELTPIAAALSLDPLAIEDALTEHERPKALRYGETLFLTAFTLTPAGETARISLFVLPGGILTVRLKDLFDIEEVAHTITENVALLRFGCRALELMLLDAVVDGYTARVNRIDEQLDDLEEIMFDDHRTREVAIDTFTLHKDVGLLRRVVLPMRDVAGGLVRRTAADQGQRDLLPFAEDVYDHVMRAADWTDNLRDAVDSVRSTNLALVDNRLNEVMRKLTAWAAIVAVPTAVTGYFGQNVPYPGFGKEWGFWLSIAMMLVIASALYVNFRRRHWI
jgi:magnesium transporter